MKKLLLTLTVTLLTLNAEAASLSTALQAKMDYLIARQNVVSGNIANATTPGFISQDIVYTGGKTNAASLHMTGSSSRHIRPAGTLGGFAKVEDRTFVRNDGNTVRMDEEMLKMAKIQQEYTLATRLYSKHVAMQKLAIQSK